MNIKNINIKTPKLASGLAYALENAEKKSSKDVVLNKRLDEVKGNAIKKYFEVR